jgi:hypothetical protein
LPNVPTATFNRLSGVLVLLYRAHTLDLHCAGVVSTVCSHIEVCFACVDIFYNC